jgi:glutamate receptor, ionotropic, invertebrate
MWWFFTLIMVSSYTANLAAFLTQSSPKALFDDVKALQRKAEEKGEGGFEIVYGAKATGSTRQFFENTGDPTFQKMRDYMKEHPEYMLKDNIDGVNKAEKKNKTHKFAFLMESSTIEYHIERKCRVTQIGTWLDEKGYGIAMKKGESRF